MKNRSTDLIEWNEGHSQGVGCSSTQYTLSYDHPKETRCFDENVRGQWIVAVDGATVCSAQSIQDALARTEGLEALRCILQGQYEQISNQHWTAALLMAGEMLDAATDALDRSSLAPDDQRALVENVDALQALSRTIQLESLKRERESKLVASPLN